MTDATTRTPSEESYEVLRARSMMSVNWAIVALVIGISCMIMAVISIEHIEAGTLPVLLKLIGILAFIVAFCGSVGIFVKAILDHIELIVTKSGQDAK